MFNCQINLEMFSTVKAVKKIYKYVFKGYDKATLTFDTTNLTMNPMVTKTRPSSSRRTNPFRPSRRGNTFTTDLCRLSSTLSVPLRPLEGLELSHKARRCTESCTCSRRRTALSAYIQLCAADQHVARMMLHQDISKKFTYDETAEKCVRIKNFASSIGRMVHCSTSTASTFSSRLAIVSVQHRSKIFALVNTTNKDAVLVAGYLVHDNEWKGWMSEAAEFQVQFLYVTILVNSLPSDVKSNGVQA